MSKDKKEKEKKGVYVEKVTVRLTEEEATLLDTMQEELNEKLKGGMRFSRSDIMRIGLLSLARNGFDDLLRFLGSGAEPERGAAEDDGAESIPAQKPDLCVPDLFGKAEVPASPPMDITTDVLFRTETRKRYGMSGDRLYMIYSLATVRQELMAASVSLRFMSDLMKKSDASVVEAYGKDIMRMESMLNPCMDLVCTVFAKYVSGALVSEEEDDGYRILR